MSETESTSGPTLSMGTVLGDLALSLLDNMPGAACVCDAQGILVACNAKARELCGGTLRIGMPGGELLMPCDAALSAEAPLANVLGTGAAIRDFVALIQTAAGTRTRVCASVLPLKDASGAIGGAVLVFQLADRLDEFEDFFESAVIGLHLVGPDGVILRANQAELDLLGIRSEDYVGHHIGEFHADADVLADMLERLAAGDSFIRYPARMIAADGQIRHVEVTSSPRFDGERFLYTRCFTVDVTEQHRRVEAQQQREQLAHQLLEALPAAVYTTDTQGRITFFNEASAAFAGRRPHLGDEWCVSWKMFNADGTRLPHDQCPMAVAIRERRAIRGAEAVAERPDGSRIAFAAYPTPLFDDDGVMVGAINMLVDVTSRKRDEHALQALNAQLGERVAERTRQVESTSQELHQSERNFALLVGCIVDYAVYMLDIDGNVSNWNAGAERIKGYTAAEIVGRHFSTFYTQEDRDRQLPQHALETARREGRYGAEGWRVRKDGSRFWASVVIDSVFDHGVLIGFAKVTRDVTERMHNETALIESERRARGVIDTALDGFAQVDESGRVVEWNPRAEAMFDCPRSEALGQPLATLILAPRDRERYADSLPPVMTDSTRHDGNEIIEAASRDGRRITVELSVSTLPLSGGYRCNVFMRDLSEKIFIESQLRQSQKMEAVGQLTGGIAHDFNNLLQGIIGSLDLIQLRVDAGRVGEIERFIHGALASANRAAALTHRLLAFSRRQPLDPRSVEANPLIISMEDLLLRTMGERIKVEFELAPDLWPVLCDPNQLESALLNLSINARDAMPDGGKLVIRSRNVDIDENRADKLRGVARGPYICIDVCDSGMGMPAEVVERAFDPFFTTKPAGQGTGLGLSMVYGFTHQSNGYCDIHSHSGQGATVRLFLPRHEIAETETPRPATVRQRARPGRGEVVLVVEDEPIVRNVVMEVLHQLGYCALEAGDAETALEIMRSGQFVDLLISDIGLPGMNGRALADEARKLHANLRILLMTGYASDAALPGGFLADDMEMITKPFTVEGLGKRIREMIEHDSGRHAHVREDNRESC